MISFISLNEPHLPLLLKWLELPHIKAWWDKDITYDNDKVREKCTSYINGYKLEQGIKKSIKAYIIEDNLHPIGYI